MIFDPVKFGFLTLVAADLAGDLTSARLAATSFQDVLIFIYLSSTGSDVPTTLTSDYQSFSSALSSFNGALEGVGAEDIKSGSTPLYEDVARAFYYMGGVFYEIRDLANLHDNKAGDIFSFLQDVAEDMNEPSVELVEKVNSIMEEDCSIAISGYDPAASSEYFTLIEEVLTFSSRFSRLDELTVSISSLPALSCLDGATDFSQPLASDSVPTASQSATPASSSRSAGAPQSSILEDSTSGIESSTPPESLKESSSLEDSTSSVDASNPPGSSQGSGGQGETAVTATSRSGAGSSSTGATSVSTDGAPILALNAGIFALIVAMLL